jgi:hypothetical protein
VNHSPRWIAAGLAVVISATAVACSDDPSSPLLPPVEPEDVTYAPELDIDLSQMTQTASGLYYEILTEGAGDPAAPGDTVAVNHQGWLPSGTLFSTGLFGFVLDDNAVIEGFDEGVIGMLKGEVRKMVLPSRLGYADSPPPGSPIPSQSVLVFEVTLEGIGTQDLIDLGLLN